MSKQYEIKLDLDTSKLTPNGGFLMKQVPKEEDNRGFKEQTGAEIFAMFTTAAITGANPKCGYDAMKNFRRISKAIDDAVEGGVLTLNKTDIDIIKNSIRGNQHWPNNEEVGGVLDQIMDRLGNATEIT